MHTILFDLDGTLTDPKVGIVRCIEFALQRLDAPIPDDLLWCIGPPLHESFLELLGQQDRVNEAIALYRDRFSDVGLFENTLYEGIVPCLGNLRDAGHRLFLATSKPTIYASKILRHFDLSAFFEEEYGSELNGTRTNKSELIAYLMAKESLDPAQTVMVGDRKHDLIGAKNNGLRYVGVSYGYGSVEELNRCAPERILDSPEAVWEYFREFYGNVARQET